MSRYWQSSDGTIRQPEHGTPEWTEHLRNHLKRVMDSHGPVSAVEVDPFEIKEHALPYNDTKTQFYRRLLKDGQHSLPIVVAERPEGGYTLVDGIHRLGVHQLLNKPVRALVVKHGLQKMAIADVQLGRRVGNPTGRGEFRYDYSHTLPAAQQAEGYKLNVYHTVGGEAGISMRSVLTHPTGKSTIHYPGVVGSVTGELKPSGKLSIGNAHVDEEHRGGKGLALYESLLAHAHKKLGAHTVVGGEHSTLAHKVHQKLSLKHGMDYEAKTYVPQDSPPPETGPYDNQFGDYSYAIKSEALDKAIGPIIASMMMAASPGHKDQHPVTAAPMAQMAMSRYKPWSPEGLHPDLVPIAHLESSWGKNITHGAGKNEMDTAFGALGFKPQTAYEEYSKSKSAQKLHPNLLDQNAFLNEFRGNPEFYNHMASQHFNRLTKLHGSPEKAAYAWRWGSTAAANADDATIESEPYVQKYKALKSVKKLGKSRRDKESVRVASIAAYNDDGLLLFGLRGDTSKWCLPGGHLEPGEDKLDGAKRELTEETGLTGKNWKYLGSGEVPDKDVTVYCFTCDVEGDPDADSDPDLEFLHFEWVHPGEIPEHILSELHNKHDINLELQDIDHSLAKGMMGDWKSEGYTLRHNGQMGLDINDPKHQFSEISAHDPAGNKVGWLAVGTDGDPKFNAMKGNIKIDEAHRRKGLASAMYAMAEKIHGLPIEPEQEHTSYAEALWNQPNRQFGPAEIGQAKLTDKNPPTDPGALEVYNKTPHKYQKSEDLDKAVLDPNAGYTISHEESIAPPTVSRTRGQIPETKYIKVFAHHGGKVVGCVHLDGIRPGHTAITAFNTDVEPAHQRKGLASAMYAHAEKVTGLKMKPSSTQSPAGRMLWEGNENNPQFGKSETLDGSKPKVSPEEKNLVVTHNISEDGLEHAHKLGGLPAPSLAIAHKDHPLNGFGEVTLVAPHHLADPAQHPVFDADIYSPRQPRAEYKINDKKMSKFIQSVKPHYDASGQDNQRSIAEEFKRYGPSLTRGTYYTHGLKHMFLKETGHEVPEIMKDAPIGNPWVKEPALQSFFKEHGVNSQFDHDSDYAKKLAEATKASIQSWKPATDDPEDEKYLKEHFMKEMINPENGEVYFGRAGRIFKDHANFDRKEPDSSAMREYLDNKVKEVGEDQFHDWAEKKMEHLDEGKYIPKWSPNTGTTRKIPFSLDNLLKEMTSKKTKGGEGFNYGLGSVRAVGAKKFKDLEQMRQHQGQILPHGEFEKVKDHMNQRFHALSEDLAPYHGSRMNSISALSEAIAGSYRKGKYLGSELKLSGFDNVPAAVQRKVNEFAQDLVRMPTEYFESKPQRVVGLNEFKGAVVPTNAKKRTIEHLKANGLHDIRYYDPNKPGDRAKAINLLAQAQKLHLSEDEFYGTTFLKEDLDAFEALEKGWNWTDESLEEPQQYFNDMVHEWVHPRPIQVPIEGLKSTLEDQKSRNSCGVTRHGNKGDPHFPRGAPSSCDKHIAGIAEALKSGQSMPPMLLEQLPEGGYRLADGNHRLIAARTVGMTHVPALVMKPKALEKGAVDPWFQAVASKNLARKQRIQNLVSTTRGSVWASRHGGHLVVGKDPHNLAQWRVTPIAADGTASSHSVAKDHSEALLLAHSLGANILTPPVQTLPIQRVVAKTEALSDFEQMLKTGQELGEALQKSKKDAAQMYKPDSPGAPQAKEHLDWAYGKLPNENWSLWATRHHRDKPEDFTPKVKKQLESFAAKQNIPEIAKVRFDKTHDLNSGLEILKGAEDQYHRRLKSQLKLATKPKSAKKIIDAGDGYSWWSLGKGSCSAEGKAMGHCGNVPSEKLNDNVLSLRKEHNIGGKKYYEPHLTFIQNGSILGEMKGRGNLKPAEHYHDKISKLLATGLMPVGGGYLPKNNFNVNDFSDATYQGAVQANPSLKFFKEKDMSPETVKDLLEKTNGGNGVLNRPEGFEGIENIPAESQKLIMEKGSESTRRGLAAHPSLTPELQSAIVNSPEPINEMETGLAENPKLTDEAFEKLTGEGDEDGYMARQIARNTLSPSQQVKLVGRADLNINEGLINNKALSPEAQMALYARGGLGISASRLRSQLALHRNLAPEVEERLARSITPEDPGLAHQLAHSSRIGPATQAKIMEQLLILPGYDAYRLADNMARNTNLLLEHQKTLASHPNVETRQALAQNRNVDPSLHPALLKDQDPEVRANMAANKNFDPSLQIEAAKDKEYGGAAWGLSMNPEIKPEAQRLLWEQMRPRERMMEYCNLLPELFAEAAKTNIGAPRIARNPHLPPDIQLHLTRDPGPETGLTHNIRDIYQRLARNPALTNTARRNMERNLEKYGANNE